ncbi:MAG: hypothetical protein ACLRSW_16285 [Christensenellaceae bacterium]
MVGDNPLSDIAGGNAQMFTIVITILKNHMGRFCAEILTEIPEFLQKLPKNFKQPFNDS